MKMEASGKTAVFEKKPHIKKGYYPARLTSLRPRQKEDGTLIEGQYGTQIVLVWEILDPATKEPIVIAIQEEGKAAMQKHVHIAQVLNDKYKQKDGSYRTAVTPNALITKVYKALGWVFDDSKPFETDDFIGRICEVNIDDYDAKFKEQDGQGNDVEKTYKASCIKAVNKLEGGSSEPSPNSPNDYGFSSSEGNYSNKWNPNDAVPEETHDIVDGKMQKLDLTPQKLEPVTFPGTKKRSYGDTPEVAARKAEIDNILVQLRSKVSDGNLTPQGYEIAKKALEGGN